MNQSNCPHLHTVTYANGSHHLTAGTVWDDQEDLTICLDCGCELDPGSGLEPADLAALRADIHRIQAHIRQDLANTLPQSEGDHNRSLLLFRLDGILEALNRNASLWRKELHRVSLLARQLGMGIPLLDDLAERYVTNG